MSSAASSVSKLTMKGLSCVNNCKDTITSLEVWIDGKNKAPKDGDVDVVGYRKNVSKKLTEPEDPDATDYSSSFANTASDDENCCGYSESEVESHFIGDNVFSSTFNAFRMRKKKVTNHWRNFIRPVMWRCKWMELRIKEFESQSRKYSKVLATYKKEKHLGVDQFLPEGSCSKSLPFLRRNNKKAMRRRKRKRVEDTTDITSYMLQHNLFSYIENKKSDQDSTSMADEGNTAGVTISERNTDGYDKIAAPDKWTSFELQDSDSIEQLLSRIETAHNRIQMMKSQMDLLMSQNSCMFSFSSSENLSFLALDMQTSSADSFAFGAGIGEALSPGAIYNTTQNLSEFDLADLAIPECVSSFGEAMSIPDIIESNMGLLSATDVTLHQPQFGDSTEYILDNVLTRDEAAEEEKQTLEGISTKPQENNQETGIGGQESTNPCPTPSSADSSSRTSAPQEQPSLKSSLASDENFPRNKRKRGERKAGPSVWK
ncbi:hypothetical protein UlMin_016444 [Ulmus minor]